FSTGDYISSSPALGGNGTIYFGSADWNLYAVRGSGNLAGTAWPMFHRNVRHTGKYFPPPTVTPALTPEGQFQLIFIGQPGQNYEVTASFDLLNWYPFAPIVGAPGVTNLIDPASDQQALHFFRVWSR